MAVLVGVFVLAAGGSARAGGSCITNADCNQSTNFCQPGTCDLFGQCHYGHDDAVCRVPPYGDNLFCNGVDFCNETLNGGAGGCDINPVNCVPPTPQCSETLNACVECLNNSQCTTAPRLTCNNSTGTCVQCLNDGDCNDGLVCNGQETCDGTGLCQAGTPISCSPGQFCSEVYQGLCVQCEQDGDCNDGLYCSGVETCNQTTHTCTTGTAVACKSCNGGTTAGAPCLNDGDCGVGGTCNGPSTFCNESNDSCVQCLTNAPCNDGKFCTADLCIFNTCVNNPDPVQFCDDGVYCNGAETCNGSTGQCGSGTPPNCTKTCFRGLTPGATCTTDTGCGKACDAGLRAGLTCVTDSDCTGMCEGGADAGEACADGSTCGSTVCGTGLCIPGQCRGGCSEQFDACVQCASDVSGSTSCDDALFCDGVETCNGQHQCAAGSKVSCTELNDIPCAIGKCNETSDQCARIATPGVPNGQPCNDGSVCTRVDYCQNSFCVENPPASNDPYRCVKMEWRPTTAQSVVVGSTVSVDLYLVADGCNTPSDDCTDTQHPVQAVNAILSWDPTVLQFKPSTTGDKNPLDPCDNGNSCYVCSGICSGGSRNGLACDNVTTLCPGGLCDATPPTYNWSNSFFLNDCQEDSLNQPCSGFPANDGNALYTALPQISCGANPARTACATTSGLNVTKFKFKALSLPPGGSTQVSLQPCFGTYSETKVVSGVLPPSVCVGGNNPGTTCQTNAQCTGGGICGYTSSDVTKSIGPVAVINILSCGLAADCVDADPCTVDSCVSGTCRHDPMQCADSDACTIDACSNGTCTHTPIACGAGNRCFEGQCYKTCITAQDCDDSVACTIDTCFAVTGDDICKHATDDSLCVTGLFCSAKICDLQLGCVFDHVCVSANGNPCDNPASCDENADNCGGCLAPAAVAAGTRYLKVTPAIGQGTTPVAILLEGDCLDGTVGCLSKYVQPLCAGGANNGLPCLSGADCPSGSCDMGFVGSSPVYMTAAQWGTVFVHAGGIIPKVKYQVFAGCNFGGPPVFSAPSIVQTYRWGDTDGNTIVNFADISGVVNAFKNIYTTTQTYQSTNVAASPVAGGCGDPQTGCVGQACLNFLDISMTVDAFKSKPYPCPAPCP